MLQARVHVFAVSMYPACICIYVVSTYISHDFSMNLYIVALCFPISRLAPTTQDQAQVEHA